VRASESIPQRTPLSILGYGCWTHLLYCLGGDVYGHGFRVSGLQGVGLGFRVKQKRCRRESKVEREINHKKLSVQ